MSDTHLHSHSQVDAEYRQHPLLPALVDSRNRSHYDPHDHHVHHEHPEDASSVTVSPSQGSYQRESNVRYVLVTPEMLQKITNEKKDPSIPTGADISSSSKMGKGETEHVEIQPPTSMDTGSLKRTKSTSSAHPFENPEELDFPNKWGSWRHTMREAFAEFLGTCILLLFGNGVNMQVFMSTNSKVSGSQTGSYLSVNFGWGIGVLCGVYVSGGISGGHINPAVTLALAVWRGFPWRKVPIYWLAQVLGALCGSALVYLNYVNAVNLYEGGPNVRTYEGDTSTAHFFSTYPAAYMPKIAAFFDEFLGTAILLIVVLAISDRKNSPPPDGMNPIILMWLIVGIGAAFGLQTAYAINPARDLGPRLMTWFVGYGGGVWTYRDAYWLYTPVVGPFIGANFGALVYDLLIYTGTDSPLNRVWRLGHRKKAEPAVPAKAESAEGWNKGKESV